MSKYKYEIASLIFWCSFVGYQMYLSYTKQEILWFGAFSMFLGIYLANSYNLIKSKFNSEETNGE